jgi:thiamine kinase-like enzyme
MTTSPESDLEWKALLKHYSLFHKISPETVKIELSSAVTDMRNIKTGKEMIQQQMDCMPYEAQPEFIRSLLKSFKNKFSLEDNNVKLSLCRGDANHLNFIHQPDGIASVDWENSGWSDPSFEIAELIAHPCYIKVPFSRKEWIVNMYCKLINDQEMAQRIHVFYRLMLVWWVARFARFFYEVSQGIDKRFKTQTNEWQLKMQSQYDFYVNLVENLL